MSIRLRGLFSVPFAVAVAAYLSVALGAPGEDKPVETTILAQGIQIEKTGQPARPEVLEEMAKVSKGRIIQPAQLADLIKEITALPAPRPLENRIPLWSHWATVASLVSL